MTTPIQIRREDVVSDLRELAARRDKSITDTVAELVREGLMKDRARDDVAAREQRIEAIVREFNSLPKVGPRLTDADLYDEDGLPK